jgi:hypothetical protein
MNSRASRISNSIPIRRSFSSSCLGSFIAGHPIPSPPSLHAVIPTKAYLATKGPQLDPLLRRYLESVLTAPFTFFEVLACNPGTGMTLRDVMTKEEHSVTERGASQGMQAWRFIVRTAGLGS